MAMTVVATTVIVTVVTAIIRTAIIPVAPRIVVTTTIPERYYRRFNHHCRRRINDRRLTWSLINWRGSTITRTTDNHSRQRERRQGQTEAKMHAGL